MKRIKFRLPEDAERIAIIGKPTIGYGNSAYEKSGEELHKALQNLPGTYYSLQKIIVAEVLLQAFPRQGDLEELMGIFQRLRNSYDLSEDVGARYFSDAIKEAIKERNVNQIIEIIEIANQQMKKRMEKDRNFQTQ